MCVRSEPAKGTETKHGQSLVPFLILIKLAGAEENARPVSRRQIPMTKAACGCWVVSRVGSLDTTQPLLRLEEVYSLFWAIELLEIAILTVLGAFGR